MLKNVSVWAGIQQRHISKTSGPLLFYIESALGIFSGKNSGVYTVLGKLSLETISKFQQSCHKLLAKKDLYGGVTMSCF